MTEMAALDLIETTEQAKKKPPIVHLFCHGPGCQGARTRCGIRSKRVGHGTPRPPASTQPCVVCWDLRNTWCPCLP